MICKGEKVVLFAVPGAFTPTCSVAHLPGFIELAQQFLISVWIVLSVLRSMMLMLWMPGAKPITPLISYF
ncbi:redoxin family protein [Rheinheimera sp. A13L]|uniref:redoxin family protein n=1 Tax=Rheinheimera sp. A13L TaxID=506534 RepID=UPI002351ED42|nr:redoxin family protein [Rheinheimera sp. A13L]